MALVKIGELKMFWVADNTGMTLDFTTNNRTITVKMFVNGANADEIEAANFVVLGVQQVKAIRNQLDNWLERNGYEG